MKYIDYHDEQLYKKSLLEVLRKLKDTEREAEVFVYLIKNIISIDNFTVKNKQQLSILMFYYFYTLGEVSFTNGYSFSFQKNFSLRFSELLWGKYECNDFSQYFDFGENKIFLSNICDLTINTQDREERSTKDIVEYFLFFSFECSELYSFSGEHFPLFKWLIGELVE